MFCLGPPKAVSLTHHHLGKCFALFIALLKCRWRRQAANIVVCCDLQLNAIFLFGPVQPQVSSQRCVDHSVGEAFCIIARDAQRPAVRRWALLPILVEKPGLWTLTSGPVGGRYPSPKQDTTESRCLEMWLEGEEVYPSSAKHRKAFPYNMFRGFPEPGGET